MSFDSQGCDLDVDESGAVACQPRMIAAFLARPLTRTEAIEQERREMQIICEACAPLLIKVHESNVVGPS